MWGGGSGTLRGTCGRYTTWEAATRPWRLAWLTTTGGAAFPATASWSVFWSASALARARSVVDSRT